MAASPASPVRAGTGMRLLRTAVFAAVCVALAAAGHTVASGRTVPVWSLVLGWLAVGAVVAPLAGRERTLPGIAALLAAGQFALHAVFSLGQMSTAPLPGTASGFGPGRASGAGGSDGGLLALAARLVCHGAGDRLTPGGAQHIVTAAGLHLPAAAQPTAGGAGTSAAGGVLHMAGTGSSCALAMVLGHLLAAAVAGWLLRRGEVALWRVVRGVSQFATAVRRAFAAAAMLAEPVPCARPRAARTPRDCHAPRAVRLRHSLDRRGPPSLAPAA